MTYEEFISELRRSRRKWVLVWVNNQKWILSRNKHWQERHSPLSAVAAKVTGVRYHKVRGRRLGPYHFSIEAGMDIILPKELVYEIENASIEMKPYSRKIRSDLIAAIRLTKSRAISRWTYRV